MLLCHLSHCSLLLPLSFKSSPTEKISLSFFPIYRISNPFSTTSLNSFLSDSAAAIFAVPRFSYSSPLPLPFSGPGLLFPGNSTPPPPPPPPPLFLIAFSNGYSWFYSLLVHGKTFLWEEELKLRFHSFCFFLVLFDDSFSHRECALDDWI